jgi:SAM-dependent methyltransferase
MTRVWRLRCATCGGEAPLSSADTSTVSCRECGATLTVQDGIVDAASFVAADEDYPEALVDLIAGTEDRHFWFRARNRVILETMRRVMGPMAGRLALDVGCGTGFVLAALEAEGLNAGGIDMHRTSLLRARARIRGPLVWSNAAALPFFPDFDIVTLCDVIEHTEADGRVLQEAAGVLVPDGFLVVTVPAGPHLWTSYDEASGHKRRYDRARLADVLDRSGFRVRYLGYFNCLPLLAQVLHRALTSKKSVPDRVDIVRKALRVPPEPINTLLGALIPLEAPFRGLRWVRGGSLIAIAQRSR